MTTYAKHILNLKKLKDDPSVDNSIFICPSLIDVPKNDYENKGDVYMTNKNALYGVSTFVREDVKNKEESLITLNDLDNLPEDNLPEDIEMYIIGGVDTTYVDNNDGTYTGKCINTRCIIKHNNILVKSCNITYVEISNSQYGGPSGWGYNYENHKVDKASLTTGVNANGSIYVNTSITENNNYKNEYKYTLSTSIKQTPWSNTTLSGTYIYITVYFTVVKGDGDETELNTQQIKLLHSIAENKTANDVKYDGKLKFSYKFDETKKIFTGNNIETSYPK